MARIIPYQDHVPGYQAGDVIHNTVTGAWMLAIPDAHGGVSLERLTIRERTGSTCIGDWRLTALDVGMDLRAAGIAAAAPDHPCRSVGVDIDGRQFEVTGTLETLIAVARAAGYTIINA
jgi:hypothetical protein